MYTNDNKTPSATLDGVVDAFGSLPGVGRKTALRLALHLLHQPKDKILAFGQAVSGLVTDIRFCRQCGSPCNGAFCEVCTDRRRDERTICVVEDIRDRMTIENTGTFRGVYHLLGGLVSPMDGIGPDELRIAQLLQRVDTLQKASLEPIEVILALSGGVEGDTTALYIYRKLEPYGVKVTTLARGIAFDSDLEYADPLTLGRSILSRTPYNPNNK